MKSKQTAELDCVSSSPSSPLDSSFLCYNMDCGLLPAGVLVVISAVIPLSPHPSLSPEASTSAAPRQAHENCGRGSQRGGGENVFVLDPYLKCILLGEELAERSGLSLRLLAALHSPESLCWC